MSFRTFPHALCNPAKPVTGFAFALRLPAWLAAATSVLLLQPACLALPSFARQLNMQCIACHTEFPVLTDMGRQFKLSAYTMSAELSNLPPVAVMLQPSFTHTAAAQDGGAAPGFGDNNNYAMNQVSLFYAGRLFGPYATKWFGADAASVLNKIGIFSQTTYDGVGKAWAWDNTELRFADAKTVGEHAVQYGAYLNNNPTMQDLWNTTPAWGFPFSGSGLAPTPAAAALIDGGLAGQVAGLGAYAMIDSRLYLDVGGYRTLGARFQKSVGVDPADEAQISGLAPYWRLAYTKAAGGGTWEIGTFGLAAKTYPGRDASAGTDRLTDLGFDAEFQKTFGLGDFTALVSAIHEHASWNASESLGNTANGSDSLTEYKATVDYLWDKTYGLAVQYFATEGSADGLAYPDSQTGSPNSDGLVLQANYLPLNKTTGPAFWPRSNIKLSVQYVMYNRFNGSSTNIDGAGRSARNNNTLYLEGWIVF
ncbi:MAG TPA: hypothetical protein VL200_16745 [Lacunisphaera sp.]|jgi:hypothetical protein|nr:hypothetical protein [Lacunisphaera sp.]